MNIELAKKVLEHIKKHREAFDMHDGMTIEPSIIKRSRPNFPCGTVACIAGWTVLLHDFENATETEVADLICSHNWGQIRQRAQKLLEIDNKTVNRLFYVEYLYLSRREENMLGIARLENLIDAFSPWENTSQKESTVTS